MWTLFVVTLLPQIDDAKVTRYETFNAEKTCIVAQINLENKFQNDETAMCVYEKVVKEKPVALLK